MATRSSVRPERVHSARQGELLAALEEIFQKEGFRRVTVGELAARLRCSRKTLYDMASSKEDLFLCALRRILARVREVGEEAILEADATSDRLAAYVRPGVTEMLLASTAFFADIDSLPAAKRILDEHQEERAERIGEIIDEGVRKGVFRPANPYFLGEAIRLLAGRVCEAEFLLRADLSLGDALDELFLLLRFGVSIPPGRRKRRAPRKPRR